MWFKQCLVVFLLLCVLALGSFSWLYTEGVVRSTMSTLDSITESVIAGQWERTGLQADNALAAWQGTMPVLELYISHHQTEAVESGLSAMSAAARSKEAGVVLVKIAEVRTDVGNMAAREVPTLNNIL